MSTLIVRVADGYASAPLLTTMNLDEHELLIVSPTSLLAEMRSADGGIRGSAQTAVLERMAQIKQWVERGHTLIVLGLSPTEYSWRAGGISTKTSINQLPLFDRVKLTAKSGNSTRCDPTFAQLLDPWMGAIRYDFVLTAADLVPFVFVKTTQKAAGRPDIVAGAVPLGKGFVIFAPDGAGDAYWEALEEAPSLLLSAKAELPSWVDKFRTNWETDAFNSMATREAEVERLKTELAQLEDEIDKSRQLKQLFVGTGGPFEAAVASAMSELGLHVVKGPHPRADLLATNGKRVAAIEAKGVEGAAKEEYVRQVMMWMPEVDAALATDSELTDDTVLKDYRQQLTNLDLSALDQHQDCKGILVLGTFRLTPLDQRDQPDFSENVKAVLVRQDICALTGVQLFVLVVLARSDDALKAKVRQTLFSTRGVLELGNNWTEAMALAG